MRHHIQRAGRNYGPYSLDQIRDYVNRGNILTTDLARPEGLEVWKPVSEVLAAASHPPDHCRVGFGTYAILRQDLQFGPYSLAEVRTYLAQGCLALTDLARRDEHEDWSTLEVLLNGRGDPADPAPPSLHWGIVLLLSSMTLGLFLAAWMFVQSAWVKKIDPRSKATRYYLISMILVALAAGATTLPGGPPVWSPMIVLLSLGSGTFLLAGIFSIRKWLETHYAFNEPALVRLSRVMAFFFHVIYLQYHFTRIAGSTEANRRVARVQSVETLALTEPGPGGIARGSDHGPAGLGELHSTGQAEAYPSWGMLQPACGATARPVPEGHQRR
jgi:hypothetical protein